MGRCLGASGAERHGLAAERGVGWKLTSTPGGKPGRGWCPSRPLPTSVPRAQTHGRAGWPSPYTHTPRCPQGLRHPSTLTGDVVLDSSLHGHLRSLEIHPTGEVGAVVLGLGVEVSCKEWRVSGCSSRGTISTSSSPGPGASAREEVPRMWARKEEAPAGSQEGSW